MTKGIGITSRSFRLTRRGPPLVVAIPPPADGQTLLVTELGAQLTTELGDSLATESA